MRDQQTGRGTVPKRARADEPESVEQIWMPRENGKQSQTLAFYFRFLLVVDAVAVADTHEHVARQRRHASSSSGSNASALGQTLGLLGKTVVRRVGTVRVIALKLVAVGTTAAASLHVAFRRRGRGGTVEVLGIVPGALQAGDFASSVDKTSVGGCTKVGSAICVVCVASLSNVV